MRMRDFWGVFVGIVLLCFALPPALASMSASELRSRLEVEAQIFVLDTEGTRILTPPDQTATWTMQDKNGKISRTWTSQHNEFGEIFLFHEWDVKEDGTLQVTIEEFNSAEPKGLGDVTLKDSLKREVKIIKHFEPITWKVTRIKDKNVIIRFVPRIVEPNEAQELRDLPISGKDMVLFDHQGSVWATGLESSQRFVAFTTRMGTVVMSHSPFAGARRVGRSAGNQIKLRFEDGTRLSLVSPAGFVPPGVEAHIYGQLLKAMKSSGLNSVRTSESHREERILEKLKVR
jgi:hypothetical protein